jgi:hypothetical protein
VDPKSEPSIHDNFLVSYEVLCDRREIRLQTRYGDTVEPLEVTEVTFSGVACYHFEHDTPFGNVIFDISEYSADDIYRRHVDLLRAGLRYGWPGKWAESVESATAYFQKEHIRGFVLEASCGMSGWILAGDMRKVPRPGSQ